MRHFLVSILMMFAAAAQAEAPVEKDAAKPAPSPATAARPAADDSKEPSATPALVVETLTGATYDLASRRGTFVVVNFWATWCGPCIKEMPELDALDRERDDVEVVGLAFEESTKADLEAFLAKRPVHYPIALVDVYSPPKDFEVPRGLPTTYLIGPDGRIAKRFLGPVTGVELTREIAVYKAP
jgi:thiol-disulfide isomerase/thioredoxin